MGGFQLMPSAQAEWLRSVPLTYPEVGATADDQLPTDYPILRLGTEVGHGAELFERLTERLMRWQLLSEAGLEVWPSSARVEPDAVVITTLRLLLPIRTRCRVVYLIDEPRRRGFGYGTLPGHPLSGEERFLITHHDDDRVTFEVTAFARYASPLARAGGPVSRAARQLVVRRYLTAARRTGRAAPG